MIWRRSKCAHGLTWVRNGLTVITNNPKNYKTTSRGMPRRSKPAAPGADNLKADEEEAKVKEADDEEDSGEEGEGRRAKRIKTSDNTGDNYVERNDEEFYTGGWTAVNQPTGSPQRNPNSLENQNKSSDK